MSFKSLLYFMFLSLLVVECRGQNRAFQTTETPTTTSFTPYNVTNFLVLANQTITPSEFNIFEYIRKLGNPLKVIVPLHDLYNKFYLYGLISYWSTNYDGDMPTVEEIKSASSRKFKKIFYTRFPPEIREGIFQHIINSWEHLDLEKLWHNILDESKDYFFWYAPMDMLVQILRFLFNGKDSIYLANIIDGYNNNPGGDFRDVVNGVKGYLPFLHDAAKNFLRILAEQ